MDANQPIDFSEESNLELQKLKAQNDLLLNIVNTIPEVIVAKNWQGKFIFANQACAKLYNTTPQAMLGHDDAFFTGNQQQADFFTQNIQSIMQNFQAEKVLEDSTDANSGEIRHFESIKTPFRDEKGELNISVIAKDITEITRVKNEFEEQEKRLSYVLDATQDGLWDWCLDTDIIIHNERWGQITGLQKISTSLHEYFDCIFEEDHYLVEMQIQQALDNDEAFDCEYRMQHKDGSIVWVHDRGTVVERDAEGLPSRMVGAIHDITHLKEQQARIEELAFYDPLTKLPNRRLFDERLRQSIVSHKENAMFGAVLFLDLDHFKLLNDVHGHMMGDQLLLAVSESLQNVLKQQDVVARFGGDEFVVLLNNLAEDATSAGMLASNIAIRIRDEIAKPAALKSQLSNESISYEVTTSIGGVIFPSDADKADLVVQLADMALYQAKDAGRDSFVIFNPNMQKELDYALQLEKDLKAAIYNNELELYYQPKYCIAAVAPHLVLTGVEALIRWNSPSRGRVMPDEFIGIAEDSNLILPMGNWVFHQACKQLKAWQSMADLKQVSIAVNVSSKQIWDDHFVDSVLKIVQSYAIQPELLKIEITESVLLRDLETTIVKLNKLKSAGIKVSLDDFGTGYSSLSYLKRLPVDEIKIDRSFVGDIVEDSSDFMMTKAMVDIGHNFNVTVVAEGVENTEQLNCLKSMGDLCYQGYFFSRPVPIEEFSAIPLKVMLPSS